LQPRAMSRGDEPTARRAVTLDRSYTARLASAGLRWALFDNAAESLSVFFQPLPSFKQILQLISVSRDDLLALTDRACSFDGPAFVCNRTVAVGDLCFEVLLGALVGDRLITVLHRAQGALLWC